MSTLAQKKSREVWPDSMLSVEDWLTLSDTKPRYELIVGKLVQKSLKTSSGVWAIGEFLCHCAHWGHPLGWHFLVEGMGYKADVNNGFVPDIVGFAPGQKIEPSSAYMTETPFLVMEVLSPATAKQDRTHKKEWYATGGVPIYIIIDPANRTLEIFRLQEGNTYGAPEVLGRKDVWEPEELPGLKLELKDLWMS